MKLGDFLNNLARKCNKESDQALIDFLGKADIVNIDISDDLANSIDSGLMSLDGAKNNSLLKNHFSTQALNAVDKEILTLATDLNFGDDFLGMLNSEKNTYNKVRSIKSVVEKIREEKGKETDPTKKAELENQIRDLNSKIASMQDEFKVKETGLIASHNEQVKDFVIDNLLSGKNYANKDLPKEAQVKLAKILLKDKLSEKGAVLQLGEDRSLKLRQKDNPDMEYLEVHRGVNFNDFVDGLLAENKMLAVSGVQSPNNPAPTHVPAGGEQANAANFINAVNASSADLKN